MGASVSEVTRLHGARTRLTLVGDDRMRPDFSGAGGSSSRLGRKSDPIEDFVSPVTADDSQLLKKRSVDQ